MMFTKSIAALALLAAQQVSAVYFVPVDNEDAISQCHNITLSWKGRAPFQVFVYPGCSDDPDTDTPISSFNTSDTSAKYWIQVSQGKSLQFAVLDAKNEWDYSADYDVQDSGIKSCLSLPSQPWTSNSTSSTPSTQIPTATDAPLNPGKLQATTTYTTSASAVAGGALNGAFSSFAPRTEMAAFAAAVVVGAVTFF